MGESKTRTYLMGRTKDGEMSHSLYSNLLHENDVEMKRYGLVRMHSDEMVNSIIYHHDSGCTVKVDDKSTFTPNGTPLTDEIIIEGKPANRVKAAKALENIAQLRGFKLKEVSEQGRKRLR